MIALLLILSSCLLLSLFSNWFLFKGYKRQDRQHQRDIMFEREYNRNLLDRLMHVTGNTWTLPPRENLKPEEEILDPELQRQLEGWREV